MNIPSAEFINQNAANIQKEDAGADTIYTIGVDGHKVRFSLCVNTTHLKIQLTTEIDGMVWDEETERDTVVILWNLLDQLFWKASTEGSSLKKNAIAKWVGSLDSDLKLAEI